MEVVKFSTGEAIMNEDSWVTFFEGEEPPGCIQEAVKRDQAPNKKPRGLPETFRSYLQRVLQS